MQTTRVVDASVLPDLRLLARRQRWLLWTILAMMLVYCLAPTMIFTLGPAMGVGGGGPTNTFAVVVGILYPLVQLAMLCVVIVVMVLVMAALRQHVAWRVLAILFLLVPLVNLFTLLMINRRATLALRSAGLRVGFMGVADEDVVRLTSGYLCRSCGYNLTGNVSGMCPECGVAIVQL